MRRLLVLLILLAVAAVAADRALVAVAESRAEAEVAERVDITADVELHGTLAGLRLLLGNAPLVTAEARDVTLSGGVRLARLRAELTDVRVSLDMSAPSARSADFEAEMDGAELLRLVPLPDGLPVGLVLEANRLLWNLGDSLVEARISAVDGVLVIESEAVPDLQLGLPSLHLDLSDRPGGPEIREVEIRDHRVILRGVLRELLRQEP